MSKKRNYITEERKQSAVAEYVSGKRRAEDIANELGVPQGYLYRWRVQFDEKSKGARAEELESMGHSKFDSRKIQSLELELEEYKKKVAEQSLVIDLLKKLRAQPNFQPESELTGLIKTIKLLDQKRKPSK